MSSKWLNWVDGDRGVSPVIGVILMVAIVVLLVGIAGTYAFTTADDSLDTTGEERDRLFDQLDEKSGTADSDSDDGNEDDGDGSEDGSGGDEDGDGGGTEEVVGSVSVNPDISGAEVTAFDADGNKIDTVETNKNGTYEFNDGDLDSIDSIRVVANGETDYDGRPFYASYQRDDINVSGDNVANFTFTGESTTQVNGNDVTVAYQIDEATSDENHVGNIQQLQAIGEHPETSYQLIRDIDASGTSSWNGGKGFVPIEDEDYNFLGDYSGTFDGNSYSVNGLYINRPTEENIGMFKGINDAEIKNIYIEDSTFHGNDKVGGLARSISNSHIKNVHVKADVTANTGMVGGFTSIHSTDGLQEGSDETSLIEKSSFEGNVESNGDEYDDIGGFVGRNYRAIIKNSYSSGSVDGGNANSVGGFVGMHRTGNASMKNAYSTSSVSGDRNTGGLIGKRYDGQEGDVVNSYWNVDSTGQSNSDGGTGLTTDEMQGSNAESNMDGFDFSGTWTTVDGDYPELQDG